jgi:hypothetical protein
VDAVCEEEGAGERVIELPANVALDGFNDSAILSANVDKKVSQSRERVRFETKRKCPNIVGIIIEYN